MYSGYEMRNDSIANVESRFMNLCDMCGVIIRLLSKNNRQPHLQRPGGSVFTCGVS